MKGIAHFLSGVAAATFLPGMVAQAAQGSFLPALAGMCALLPDTLDFRFARFFERADVVLGPEGGAARLAAALQGAVASAAAGRAQTVRLRSARIAHDRWRRYSVRFDVAGQAVEVRVGPLVTGGQVPLPGSQPAQDACARAALAAPLEYGYDAEITADVFAGPSLRFEPAGPAVRIEFLPWHRAQTHSLVVAVAIGLLAALAFGPLAGAAATLGFAAHVLEDQLGAMGSNLLWPLTRRRTAGLGLLRSGDALPNFVTVWSAVALILFNLDRFAPQPQLDPAVFLGGCWVLPAVAMLAVYIRQRRRARPGLAEQAREALAEVETDGAGGS